MCADWHRAAPRGSTGHHVAACCSTLQRATQGSALQFDNRPSLPHCCALRCHASPRATGPCLAALRNIRRALPHPTLSPLHYSAEHCSTSRCCCAAALDAPSCIARSCRDVTPRLWHMLRFTLQFVPLTVEFCCRHISSSGAARAPPRSSDAAACAAAFCAVSPLPRHLCSCVQPLSIGVLAQ